MLILNTCSVLAMSDIEEENNNLVTRRARRKVPRKRENRDDIFSYRNQIPLSFKAKQFKIDDSSDSEDNEDFQRVMEIESSKMSESSDSGEDDM